MRVDKVSEVEASAAAETPGQIQAEITRAGIEGSTEPVHPADPYRDQAAREFQQHTVEAAEAVKEQS